MNPDLLETVRRTCRETARRARLVTIDRARLEGYARSLAAGPGHVPGIDEQAHFLNQGERTAAFFVILDTVNFGSGYFPCLRKRPGCSGYYTIASALADRFRSRSPLTAGELAEITPEKCAELFSQDLKNTAIAELMDLFARAWRDLGNLLLEQYGGECAALIESAQQSAEELARRLTVMPFFNDTAAHEGRPVAFYKRAQILASDLHLAFDGGQWGRFGDIDRLTIFADNLVPHVLRMDGILCYEPSLLAKIEAGELLPAGSPEEVEIRACAVHAAELMGEIPRREDRRVPPRIIDMVLWRRGQRPEYKSSPRHRARTVFY